MKSIALPLIGILSASALAWADDGQPVFDPNVPFHVSQLTIEQQGLANEIFNDLSWKAWSLVGRFLIVDEPANVVEDERLKIDQTVDEAFRVFDPYLNVELLFLRKVCDLPSHEMQSLADSSQAVLKLAVRDFVLHFHEHDDAAVRSDELAMIDRAPERVVLQVAECQLSAEQWEQFSREFNARMAQRRRMTIRCLVARLDLDLKLSITQREQFVTLFESSWHDSWAMSLNALTEQQNFMPELSAEEVATILSESQQQKLVELEYCHDPDGDAKLLDIEEALSRVIDVDVVPKDDEQADDENVNENTSPMDH